MRRSARWAAGVLAAAALGPLAAGDPGDLPPPPGPDPAFYARRVAPWVEAHCAGCHRAGGGSLRLAAPALGLSEEARRRLDFEQVAAYVTSEAPEESPLLLKVLDPLDGGVPHVGGPFVKAETDEHDLLLDFVSGATPTNLPPEVWLGEDRRAKPGEAVVVDGQGSFDRDREDALAWRWELAAKPPGSRVALSDVRAPRVEFTPDVGGTYVLRLRVGDGKVWSAPRSVGVEVFERVAPEAGARGALSGLAAVEPEALRRVRRLYLDLLGRPPTPEEALAEARAPMDRLVEALLARTDAGRAWVEEVAARLGLVGESRPQGAEARDLALRAAAEGTPPPALEAVLARDPAFLEAHPPGRALAQAIARGLLGRPETEAEVAAAATLAAGGPAEVPGLGPVAGPAEWVRLATDTPGFREAAVRRRLERFLPSGDAERLLPRGVRAAGEGGGAWRAFLSGVLRSPAYLERRSLRAKDPLTFLRGLFVDLLGRRPTDRELLAFVRAADVLPGRSAPLAAAVKVLIDSGEAPLPLLVDIPDAPAWVKDRFLRHLGRPPSPAELAAFGAALLDPAGGPEVVVRALLTSPEYACR